MDFQNFINDMGIPSSGDTLERIDVNGNYEPENCKWIPRPMQSRNRRTCRKLSCNGVVKNITDWCRDFGVSRTKMYGMIQRNGEENAVAAMKREYETSSI
jgi:hypothetical protein